VLPDEKPDMREYLVELMRRFELCFPLGEAGGVWLVPQKLPAQQPKLDKGWREDATALRLRYEYDVLPEGLLPRFIVRTYALSEGQHRWRDGVVLAFEGASALVRADTFRGEKVEIVVRGRAEPMQRLAAIIRENFARIHADIKELKPRELMEVSGQRGLYQEVAALQKTEASSPMVHVATASGDVDLDKTAELNRLMPEQSRKTPASSLRVFVSYSHKDERLKDDFGLYLDLLKNEGSIQVWHDRRLVPGQEWDKEIRRELEEADIVIFLVSTPFLASGYIQGVEVASAMERYRAGKAVIVPVILERCSWERQEWEKFQALPKDGKPVTKHGRRADAWHGVEQGLRRTIASLRGKEGAKGQLDPG
jgi:internalin A